MTFNSLRQCFFWQKEKRRYIRPYTARGVWKDFIKIDSCPVTYEMDNEVITIYESFIQDCINSKVKLFVICLTFYRIYTHAVTSVLLAGNIAKKYQVPSLDYSQDSIFIHDAKLFDDPGHLNDNGSQVFLNTVADSINH
jgi:hypothetical protein